MVPLVGARAAVLVEGASDQAALESLAVRLGRDLAAEGVHVLPMGEQPHTRHVRGSNMTFIGVAKDRREGRAIVISALDNLVKGASGQAIQNMNLVLGYPEATGLEQIALFP